MSHPSEANPEASPEATPATSPQGKPEPGAGAAAHDFEVQKRIHQTIRNDPDYDDWEYGTEPLPHEAWVEPKAAPEPGPSGGEG